MPSTITLAQLKTADACADQRALFKKTFGASVEVTEALCASVADKFDWDWASAYLLGAPALAEYERARATAWAEYERVCAPAWADYERARATAMAEYERACATAFARVYLAME
jgi:hypothetical protein